MGASVAGLAGAMIGLLVGLAAYPPTAAFAVIELGVPARSQVHSQVFSQDRLFASSAGWGDPTCRPSVCAADVGRSFGDQAPTGRERR